MWDLSGHVSKKFRRSTAAGRYYTIWRAIRDLYESYTIWRAQKSPWPLPFLSLELRGFSDWNSTLTLTPWLHLVPCTSIASQFSIPYLHLHTFTCTLWFPFTHFYMHTFGHSFKFSLFCNLFLLAFPLKLTFRLDCFVVEVSHLHYSVLLFFWTRFILCRSLTQPPGLEFLSRVINLYTLRHDIPV